MEVQDRYSVCEDWLVMNLGIDEAYISEKMIGKSIDHSVRAYICECFEDAMRKSHFKFSEGNIYAFDGRVYRKSSSDVIGAVLSDVMRRKKFPSLYRVESREPVVKHVVGQLARHKFRPDKNLISLQNCVYDIALGETMPHSADLNTTTFLDFEYDPKAKCPGWMKFLSEVVESEAKMVMLQEYLGAAFIDRRKYKMEYMLFLTGSGQNGKGVFTNVIQELFGLNAVSDDDEKYEAMISTFSPQELFREGNGREYRVSSINGKLLNICEDMSNQDFSGGDFKKAVSGEFMSARDPYGKPFTATQIPLFIASCNDFPKALDRSEGNYRRYWVVEFNVKISKDKKDPMLKHKLLEEKSGIFNWIIEGYKRVIKNGGNLTPSDDNDRVVAKLRIQQDSRLEWLQESGYSAKPHQNAERVCVSVKELYKSYVEYCKDNNYNSFGSGEFGKRLMQEGFESVRRSNGIHYWIYKGGEAFYDEPIDNSPVPGKTGEISFPDDGDDLPF